MALKQGSAYAISSLLSYTIVGTGIVMSLATLGVSWDKLQWLVAALRAAVTEGRTAEAKAAQMGVPRAALTVEATKEAGRVVPRAVALAELGQE